MKRQLQLIIFTFFLSISAFAQNNVFPTPAGPVGIGTTSPLEKLHVDGKIFLSAADPGQYTSTPGAIFRMNTYPYDNNWYAGFGVTRGEGVDVYGLDFYTAYGTPTIKMKLTALGGLGLGIDPLHRLHVNGNIGLADNSYISALNGYTRFLTSTHSAQPLQAGGISITDDYNNGAPVNGLFVKGNVCIGTTDPGQFKLAVKGTIGAKKVVVTQNNWADYVFEDSYKLPTLKEVEEFIKKHKHLPDVASAKEIEKEGLDVGENQAVLLKKIEELTLYLIDMQKQIDSQKKEIMELKKRTPKIKL